MSPGGGAGEIRGVECGSRWRCKLYLVRGPWKTNPLTIRCIQETLGALTTTAFRFCFPPKKKGRGLVLPVSSLFRFMEFFLGLFVYVGPQPSLYDFCLRLRPS